MSNRPALWKQLLGAGLGGAVAIALYYGVESGIPRVTAYVSTFTGSEEEPVRFARKEDPGEFDRIAKRTKQIAQQYTKKRIMGATSEEIEDEDSNSDAQTVEERRKERLRKASPVRQEAAPQPQTIVQAPTPVPVAAPAPAPEPKESVHEGAPNLPSSGVAEWLAVIVALIGTAAWRIRKRARA